MRTIQTKIYTIDELKKENKQGFENALQNISERRVQSFMDHYSSEMMDTLEAVAEKFYMEIMNYNYDLFSTSHITVNIDDYMELENSEKNNLVQWLKDNLQSGKDGSCPFTGVCYDADFFDQIEQLSNGDINYNNLHVLIPDAIEKTLNKILKYEGDNILNDNDNFRYAQEMELEFLESGEIY
ncbi:hypothetical protein Q7A53_05890 [Halobacillus rhizosphaerae]|uniref:hypothetical protein n=1 Tax=Halobacillus rhizosphaerae TaxID=3064889 RepID=UPI00398B5437